MAVIFKDNFHDRTEGNIETNYPDEFTVAGSTSVVEIDTTAVESDLHYSLKGLRCTTSEGETKNLLIYNPIADAHWLRVKFGTPVNNKYFFSFCIDESTNHYIVILVAGNLYLYEVRTGYDGTWVLIEQVAMAGSVAASERDVAIVREITDSAVKFHVYIKYERDDNSPRRWHYKNTVQDTSENRMTSGKAGISFPGTSADCHIYDLWIGDYDVSGSAPSAPTAAISSIDDVNIEATSSEFSGETGDEIDYVFWEWKKTAGDWASCNQWRKDNLDGIIYPRAEYEVEMRHHASPYQARLPHRSLGTTDQYDVRCYHGSVAGPESSASNVAQDTATAGTAPTESLNVSYLSSIDNATSGQDVKNLKMSLMYVADGEPKPILAMVHGYQAARDSLVYWARAAARRGFFVINIELRADPGDANIKHYVFNCTPNSYKTNDSAKNVRDFSMRDTQDVIDAFAYAIANYAGEVDSTRKVVVGISAGGRTSMSVVTRFPDFCNIVVPAALGIDAGDTDQFGATNGWQTLSAGHDFRRNYCVLVGEAECGIQDPIDDFEPDLGVPALHPNWWRARCILRAVHNPATPIHIYADRFDRGYEGLVYRSAYEWEYQEEQAGLSGTRFCITTRDTGVRCMPHYSANEPVADFRLEWSLRDLLDGNQPEVTVPASASNLFIRGYQVSKRYKIYLEDITVAGSCRKVCALMDYDFTGNGGNLETAWWMDLTVDKASDEGAGSMVINAQYEILGLEASTDCSYRVDGGETVNTQADADGVLSITGVVNQDDIDGKVRVEFWGDAFEVQGLDISEQTSGTGTISGDKPNYVCAKDGVGEAYLYRSIPADVSNYRWAIFRFRVNSCDKAEDGDVTKIFDLRDGEGVSIPMLEAMLRRDTWDGTYSPAHGSHSGLALTFTSRKGANVRGAVFETRPFPYEPSGNDGTGVVPPYTIEIGHWYWIRVRIRNEGASSRFKWYGGDDDGPCQVLEGHAANLGNYGGFYTHDDINPEWVEDSWGVVRAGIVTAEDCAVEIEIERFETSATSAGAYPVKPDLPDNTYYNEPCKTSGLSHACSRAQFWPPKFTGIEIKQTLLKEDEPYYSFDMPIGESGKIEAVYTKPLINNQQNFNFRMYVRFDDFESPTYMDEKVVGGGDWTPDHAGTSDKEKFDLLTYLFANGAWPHFYPFHWDPEGDHPRAGESGIYFQWKPTPHEEGDAIYSDYIYLTPNTWHCIEHEVRRVGTQYHAKFYLKDAHLTDHDIEGANDTYPDTNMDGLEVGMAGTINSDKRGIIAGTIRLGPMRIALPAEGQTIGLDEAFEAIIAEGGTGINLMAHRQYGRNSGIFTLSRRYER